MIGSITTENIRRLVGRPAGKQQMHLVGVAITHTSPGITATRSGGHALAPKTIRRARKGGLVSRLKGHPKSLSREEARRVNTRRVQIVFFLIDLLRRKAMREIKERRWQFFK